MYEDFQVPVTGSLIKKITANFIRLEIPKTRSVTYLDPGFYFVEGGEEWSLESDKTIRIRNQCFVSGFRGLLDPYPDSSNPDPRA